MSNENALIDFIEDFSPALPVERRIAVYRGAAERLADGFARNRFAERAAILAAAEAQCLELRYDAVARACLRSSAKSAGKTSGGQS